MAEPKAPLPTSREDQTHRLSSPIIPSHPSCQNDREKPKTPNLLRDVLRWPHYNLRTEGAYFSWVKRYIYFFYKLKHHARKIKRKIDSTISRVLYGIRLARSEPPFSHVRSVLGLNRFTLR